MSNPKELRKQLRNVVQDLLPELLQAELMGTLQKEMRARLDAIDSRQKDLMSFLIRQSAKPVAAPEGTKSE